MFSRIVDEKVRVLGLGLALLFVLALSGCDTEEVVVPVPPTATPVAPPPISPPTVTPKPTLQALAFPLPAPARASAGRLDDHTCVDCHTSEQALQSAVERTPASQPTADTTDWSAHSVQAAAWERVWLDQPLFFETMHGRFGCIACHGGTGDTNLPEVAHQGLVAGSAAAVACGDCHAKEVAEHSTSLHANQDGYRAILAARSSPTNMHRLEEMMANHCDGCHSTPCGQCHITRPPSMGGGLVDGHLFRNRLPPDETCAGCHGSRIYAEYKGEGDISADVHWVQGQMSCFDCHPAEEVHALQGGFVSRYDGPPSPGCDTTGCHPDVGDDAIEQHDETHLQALSCQACHSTAYRNCYGCHVDIEEGVPAFQLEPSKTQFKIGRNPQSSPERPWEYVPVRHVPVTRDSLAYYGQGLLDRFDAQSVWKYATPHNIQRLTPQNERCNACHGNAQLFLTVDDLAPDEWQANRDVIVEAIPPAVE